MEWLNLHTSILDSPELVGSDPIERGTWLMLLRFCIGQENSGIISDCRHWKSRKWQQLVRVTQKEVFTASELWTWHGENLHVTHYPLEKQGEVITNRLNGKKGGRPKTQTETKPHGSESETERLQIAETEGKGREGNKEGKEGEMREAQAPTLESIESIILKINTLKPSWSESPHMTQPEMHDLHKNKAGMLALTPDTWEQIRDWSHSHEGRKDWTMKTRARFVANYTEAVMKAAEWKAKGGTISPAHLSLGGRKAHSTTIV